ncbi:MAG: hypothetical protein INR64_03720 [Caulobacteraceae bacterium]|nr:hypothetical protein [Caulobacter sp.]
MAERGISNGPNGRALDENVGETAPGIADDAVTPGELGPTGLDPQAADAAAAKLREEGWVGENAADAQAETEAHPS